MFFKKKKEKTLESSNRKVVPSMKPIEELRTNKDVAEWCRDFLRITDELSPELAIADRAERNYLMALVGLLVEWFPRKDLSLESLAVLLSLADARENDENFKSALDLIFVQIEKGKTYSYVAEYHQYLWVPSTFRRNSDGVRPQRTRRQRGFRPALLELGKSSSGHPSHLPQSEPDLPSHRL